MDAQRERQRISYERHLGQVMEVMVEGYNRQREPGDRAVVAEQDGQLHHGAADSAGAWQLSECAHHKDVS